MVPLWALAGILIGAGAALVYQGLAIVYAYQMPRLAPTDPTSADGSLPKISVIVAARNEELDLPATLDDLLAQDYPNLEILVVEDGSTDGTRGVIESRAPRVRLVPVPPLPEGWIGKNWACATGARAATGEWLLFLDADVRTHPSTVRVAYRWARAEAAALTTLATRIEMGSFWERLVMPFYVQMVLIGFRAPHVNRPGSRAAMANGQFWITSRAAYERVGGHEAVRAAVVEDVALARRYRAEGLTLRVAWAPELAQTRMYRDRHEMFEGLVRTTQGADASTARLLGSAVAIAGFFLLPLGVLPLGLWTGDPLLTGVGAFLWIAIFGKHVAFDRAVGAPPSYGLLVPASAGYYIAVVSTAFAHRVRGVPVRWKGRAYPEAVGARANR